MTQFDVVGFSLGGAIAQQIGAEYPDMIRSIILLGSPPQGGEGLVFDDLSVDELDDTPALLRKAFFTQSEASQASGRAYLERLKSRVDDRDTSVCSARHGGNIRRPYTNVNKRLRRVDALLRVLSSKNPVGLET